ncbi:hypothetical protein AB0P40_15735 [Streptomyces sp. NPDC079189]
MAAGQWEIAVQGGDPDDVTVFSAQDTSDLRHRLQTAYTAG